jgi:hypothetical protein
MMRAFMAGVALLGGVSLATAADIDLKAGDGKQWYRGNTHTHTLWSDGEAAPEYAVKWYKDRGYDFLCLSDHNILSDGSVEKWVPVGGDSKLMPAQIAELTMLFGPDAVTMREEKGRDEMRLKTLPEIRTQFEEPDKFLLIQAEEITCLTPKVHVGAINLREKIAPVNSSAVEKSLLEAFKSIEEQEEKFGVPMLGHLNHPNWSSGVQLQSIVPIAEAEFFEVYNGHPGVRNWGSPEHNMVNTDRIWDIVLSLRLLENPRARFLGFATDDTHDYFNTGPDFCNGERGWVMVLAESLDADTLVRAMKQGDFYSTSGVKIESVIADDRSYRVQMAQEDGVVYTTQFIGTRAGFDTRATPVLDGDGKLIPERSHAYDEAMGVVLKETTENPASYDYAGDELYVRAKVISSRPKVNPFKPGDLETAWTQPKVIKK